MAEATEQQQSTAAEKGPEIPVQKGQEIQQAAPSRALSPFEEMDQMLERMDQLFESFFPWSRLWPRRREWPAWGEMMAAFESRLPRMDMIDRDEDIVVRTELPGVDKQDLDVSLTDDTVTIKGTTRETKEEKGDYYRSETRRGRFTRTLSLPAAVNGEKAKATFKDGILELTLPKVEGTKRRKIKVE